MAYKARATDTHFYFLGGPLSQWFPSKFKARIILDSWGFDPAPNGALFEFNCCEQYMMALKAMLFKDITTFDKIMNVQPVHGAMFMDAPRIQKALGREVANFKQDIWDKHADEIVFEGNLAKMMQNEKHRKYLLDTGDRIIVEGSKNDRIWACGLDWDDPLIEDEANWPGANRLGKVHMRVRSTPALLAL